MKKVVVTGGAGFVGSHLSEELVRQGYQVIILDDLSTGKLYTSSGSASLIPSFKDTWSHISPSIHFILLNRCSILHKLEGLDDDLLIKPQTS